MAEPDAHADATPALLASARARGLPAADPMRWRRIEALAQRLAGHQGATRRLLEARLQTLLTELAAVAEHPGPAPATPPAETSPLRALLAQLQAAAPEAQRQDAAPEAAAPRDLKVVQQHRAAWTRLRAEQRVAQAQTALPDQAGPLNSQLLLHRALTLMRETAPGYLQHFMAQAEALMWLEQAQAAPAAAAPRGKATKVPTRTRPAAKPSGRARRP